MSLVVPGLGRRWPSGIVASILCAAVPAAAEVELVEARIAAGEHERRYLMARPADRKPAALLIVLHGAGSNPERLRLGTANAFDRLAADHDVLVIYPAGVGDHWNDCQSGMPDQADRLGVDDAGFLAGLAGEIGEREGIPTSQRFVAGMSNGGEMVYRLALESPGAFAGHTVMAANLPADFGECSPSGSPVPLLVINGTADPINPWEGGEVSIFEQITRGTVRSTRDTLAWFVSLAGHEPAASVSEDLGEDPAVGTRASIERWQGGGRPTIALLTIENGGHGFPHPNVLYPPIFGPVHRGFDTAAIIWDFFSSSP
ncbi:MAG: hypothetical protein JJT85_09065 [Chromatiales bacterium]|nr:hypothetical protein [Chromatiales bacterium]